MDHQNVFQKILERPHSAWDSPSSGQAVSGLRRAMIDFDSIVDATKRPFIDRPFQAIQPALQFIKFGSYARYDWSMGVQKHTQSVLSHPKLGSVYLDHTQKRFFHTTSTALFQSTQDVDDKPTKPSLIADEAVDIDGKVGRRVRIQFGAPVNIEWTGWLIAAKEFAAFSDDLLAVMFEDLKLIPAALREILKKHLPKSVLIKMESWRLDQAGKPVKQLSEIVLESLQMVDVKPEMFSVPKQYRDYRPDSDKRSPRSNPNAPFESPDAATGFAVERSRGRISYPGTQRPLARAQRAASRNQIGVVVGPSRPKGDFEAEMPECLESTLRVSCAVEIRQQFLTHLRFLVNEISSRVPSASGSRAANASAIDLTVNWLAGLAAVGDGVFCMLTNPGSANPPGLLDSAAHSLAKDLVESAATLPLAGTPPLLLPAAAAAELSAAFNAGLRGEALWNSLSAVTQIAIRDAIVTGRLGVFRSTFEVTDIDEKWPNNDADLFRYQAAMQAVALGFSNTRIVTGLSISTPVGNPAGSQIDFSLALPSFGVAYDVDWQPGANLPWLVAGVLVAGAIALPLGVVALLMGGPIGWAILLGAIMGLPTLIPIAIVAIAVLTFLLWNATRMTITATGTTITGALSAGANTDGTAGVLEARDLVVSGGVVRINFNSEMPLGIHRIAEDIAELAINGFDLVRGQLQAQLEQAISVVLDRVPHVRAPLGFVRNVTIPGDPTVGGTVVDSRVNALSHRLISGSIEGARRDHLAYSVLATSSFTPPEHGAYFTQVDIDQKPHWTKFALQVSDAGNTVYGGYSLSQNLLNSWAHGQWLARRLENDLRENTLAAANAIIAQFCDKCACDTGLGGHVWAASSPRILAQHELFIEQATHPYLNAVFSDLRVCFTCKGREGSLELQFSATTIAELGFGTIGENGTLSLVSQAKHFAEVYYDDDPTMFSLNPGRLGMVVDGPAFAGLDALNPVDQLAFMRAMSPVLRDAAARVFKRTPTKRIGRSAQEPSRRDLQSYDSIIEARLFVRRNSVYVVFVPRGPILTILPDEDGGVLIDLSALDCAGGRALLSLI
jgi:hypothetical protein